MQIPFNKPYLSGKETQYIFDSVDSGKISGNGMFTKKCQSFFETNYNVKKCLLTTSCTDALEMAAMLCNIQAGDEVIMPAYTFVSTALAFVRQGAKVVFVDSRADHPGMDEHKIEALINNKTKAIVAVHYAGVACDMDVIMQLSKKYNLVIIEDAAQAIDSFYKGKPLGTIGHLGCFSFHETKNIQCGEGGLLLINEDKYIKRAEIIWEKGTNRSEFFRGEVNKYGWVDIGSSFLPSDILAAFLFAQLENLDRIQQKRKEIWDWYSQNIEALLQNFSFKKAVIPNFASNNAHMFYILCDSLEERNRLINFLKSKNILSVFHYLGLHKSEYYSKNHDGRVLENCDRYEDCLLRLPLYFELDVKQLEKQINEL